MRSTTGGFPETAAAIPAAVSAELAVSDRDALLITRDRGEWRVPKVAAGDSPVDDVDGWYRKLDALDAPVQADAEAAGLTAQERNVEIDEAFAAVRAERRSREAETQR
ncbi:MAG: hypothetical protein AVDCRST_MAG73-2796 [uncultured Thermomicrobiales bacterium]|uniref:Uncharacterized protein n=1 Tax=uncultured Thermomicrobiales bacterium TaxID=1645740 RepID=A0A6J4UGW9_9BACT|nr:MAG: hypothetical protein AVDCRST_MAG73-2796 [uncultured Thermomicrobiales bacterium]